MKTGEQPPVSDGQKATLFDTFEQDKREAQEQFEGIFQSPESVAQWMIELAQRRRGLELPLDAGDASKTPDLMLLGMAQYLPAVRRPEISLWIDQA